MQRIVVLLLLLVLSMLTTPVLGAIGGNSSEQLAPDIVGRMNQSDQVVTPSEESLWLEMRTLWLENVFWTRMAMTAIVQGCGDRASVQNRLLSNYQDIEETLAPYLGNDTATKYGDLIEEHNQLAVDLSAAAADKNQTAFESMNKSWFDNADRIAAFENATLPTLSFDDRNAMWHEHLDLTKNETTELINKDYDASIDTFDVLEQQTSLMADSLTNGIIQQFPTRFH